MATVNMPNIVDALRALPTDLKFLPPALNALSDAQLVRATAEAIGRPKKDCNNSFTLHAPMELLARAALLPLTPLAIRDSVRCRIAAIAAEYAEGDEIEAPLTSFNGQTHAEETLLGALRNADPGLADAAFTFLAKRVSILAIRALIADEIAPSLGAAAHVPILLASLPDACAAYGDLSVLLRAPIRALAAEANARLTWFDSLEETNSPMDCLFDALASPEPVVSPHIFVTPTMLAVEANGFAARLLGRASSALEPDEAARQLARIAAYSMLQDDPAQAPYGWSHCLTMPQGALSLARSARNPIRGVRAAATYVLGFRATLGKVRLQDQSLPDIEPDIAELVARAAPHPDAHLAKYTLSCLKAAVEDPPARPLFLAAADYLGKWWDANPDAGFEG
jgi:hypothetical protein